MLLKPLGRIHEIQINFTEFGVVKGISTIGSITLDVFFIKLIEFLKEEALNPQDELSSLKFYASINYPIIQHLYHEGIGLSDQSEIRMGNMIVITNPYSLFRKYPCCCV